MLDNLVSFQYIRTEESAGLGAVSVAACQRAPRMRPSDFQATSGYAGDADSVPPGLPPFNQVWSLFCGTEETGFLKPRHKMS